MKEVMFMGKTEENKIETILNKMETEISNFRNRNEPKDFNELATKMVQSCETGLDKEELISNIRDLLVDMDCEKKTQSEEDFFETLSFYMKELDNLIYA